MPEIPDLEVIREILVRRVVGQQVTGLEVVRPLVLRTLDPGIEPSGFATDAQIVAVSRRGKFLIMKLAGRRWIVFNFMLVGRLRHCESRERVRSRDYVLLHLCDGTDLRYNDPRGMGKIYLTHDLDQVPTFADMGPDALDSELTFDVFAERLRRYRGEIKGVLTRGACVAGIGNAYADEILFRAGIYPFRKRPTLSMAELSALYAAMHDVLTEATDVVRGRMGERLDLKVRDFLLVHNMRGQPCPRCGSPISEIKVRKRATSFCRNCQPGTLFDR